MKKNLPLTGQEKHLPAGSSLVSRTDTKGIITFVNDAFVDASGFTRAELIGSNHNIVRHPDLPPSVFEGMWRTLKRGLPWRGVVKNRCKNGDHYWVAANVVPVRKNGETIGYMSVRSPAPSASIPLAEAAYQAAASVEVFGEAGNGILKKLLTVKNGVMLGIFFVTFLMIAGGILGITGLQLSNNAMHSLYYEEMSPVQTIGRINFLMADNRAQVALALHHNPGTHSQEEFDHFLSEHLERIDGNKKEIDQLWAAYSKAPHSGQEQRLADEYGQARERFVGEGLLPARLALEQGEYAQAESLLLKSVTPLYREANSRVGNLLKFLSDKAEANFHEVQERNENISTVAIAGLSVGALIVMLSGFFFFRGTVSPLNDAVEALERITEGNLSGNCETAGYGEPGRVMNAVVIMQQHLKVMMDEIRQSSGSIHEQCQHLNHTMMNLSQHSEEQHDRVYQALDSIHAANAGLGKLSGDAEAIAGSIEDYGALSHAELAPAVTEATTEAATDAMTPATALLQGSDDPLFAELGLLALEEGGGAEAPATGGSAMLGAADDNSGGDPQLVQRARDLAVAMRIEAFSMEESTEQMNQVASLIVENRAEVQGAWAASQKLEQTAQELDRLVKFFD